jgi:putative endonuclease
MRVKIGFVYIMSNKNRTTFYIGVTNNIERRVEEHKLGKSGFSSRYNLFDFMYYERIIGFRNAIDREKQLKRWHRQWKINLIKKMNPEMKDLAAEWKLLEKKD